MGVVFTASFAAFGICQMMGPLGNAIFLLCMCGLLLSPQVCLLPLFMLLRALKLKKYAVGNDSALHRFQASGVHHDDPLVLCGNLQRAGGGGHH